MIRKCIYVLPLVAALAAVSLHARAQSGGSPLVPPNSQAYGKSFEEWNVLYAQWFEETNLGGETPSDTVGRVHFLPASSQAGTQEYNISLPPGTPFVLPTFPVIGESYDDPDVPDDNPNDPIVDFIFETTAIRVVLDGRIVMEGAADELAQFHYGPVYFDEPIVYAEPQPRGPGLNATAALWTEGIGAVYQPLPAGRHTLVQTVHSLFFGDTQFTYHITVTPHQQ